MTHPKPFITIRRWKSGGAFLVGEHETREQAAKHAADQNSYAEKRDEPWRVLVTERKGEG